ncbi:hypothetical protein LB503_012024 [Fusarium chuoi]|nr:hypothetical protein LB503_012024 [Fusarium chuoi]
MASVKGSKGAFKHMTGHLWLYKLIQHMFAEALKHKNFNLQTNTPEAFIPASPDTDGSWSLITTRGAIKARKFIVATNAYTTTLLPEYHDKIIPYRAICSHIIAMNPPLLADSYAIRFSPTDFDYLIPRPDRSIVVSSDIQRIGTAAWIIRRSSKKRRITLKGICSDTSVVGRTAVHKQIKSGLEVSVHAYQISHLQSCAIQSTDFPASAVCPDEKTCSSWAVSRVTECRRIS